MGKKRLDKLGKVMSKVSKGKKLNKKERDMLAGAIDGAKKAKSEGKYKTRKKMITKKRKKR